jgi:hypothetical protein
MTLFDIQGVVVVFLIIFLLIEIIIVLIMSDVIRIKTYSVCAVYTTQVCGICLLVVSYFFAESFQVYMPGLV